METSMRLPRPVSVVILTWNGLAYTRDCLESLRAITSHPRYRVIVVDNGSSDGTVAYLADQDWLTVIANEENRGFAAASNQGILAADGDDIILLNNDTRIIQPDWIEQLQECAYANITTGVVGCRLRLPDGRLQQAGFTILAGGAVWQYGHYERDINQYATARDVEAVAFACAYLKHELIERIGLLEESYVSYYEDADYCLRCRAQGYRTICCGDVTTIHHMNGSSTTNQIDVSSLVSQAQARYCARWEDQRPTPRMQLGWRSLFHFASGYANSSRAMALALERARVEIVYRFAYGLHTAIPLVETLPIEPSLLVEIQRRPSRDCAIEVVYAQADVFRHSQAAYRIGFTMFETDGLPAEWVRQANQMDEVFVPSSFNQQTFRESGVTRPISVIPLGFDPDYFHPALDSERVSNRYTFLSIFEWSERKGQDVLLRAFADEFSADEDVLLICKTSNTHQYVQVARDVAQLRLRLNRAPILFSLNEILPEAELGALYRAADCFVLPTRGEGWGMPILEAMACGLPVIATDWGSQRDFINATNAYPLEVERLVAAEALSPYYAGMRWAQPSYEHLRQLMRHVYQQRSESAALGRQAASDVHRRWTWDQSAAHIIQRLEAIQAQFS